MPARVLVAEDYPLVAEGFRRILEVAFDVVGIVGDGESLVAEALRLKPDIILIDISLPPVDGFEAARRIKRHWPDARMIFLTMHTEIAYLQLQHAVEVSAGGYVFKHAATKDLMHAIHEVLSGRQYMDPGLTAAVAELDRRLPATPDGGGLRCDAAPRRR